MFLLAWATLLRSAKNTSDSTRKERDLSAQSCSSSEACRILAIKTMDSKYNPRATKRPRSRFGPAPTSLVSSSWGDLQFNIEPPSKIRFGRNATTRCNKVTRSSEGYTRATHCHACQASVYLCLVRPHSHRLFAVQLLRP